MKIITLITILFITTSKISSQNTNLSILKKNLSKKYDIILQDIKKYNCEYLQMANFEINCYEKSSKVNDFIIILINCMLKSIGKKNFCEKKNSKKKKNFEKKNKNCLKNLNSNELLIFTNYLNNFKNYCIYLKILKWEKKNYDSLESISGYYELLQNSSKEILENSLEIKKNHDFLKNNMENFKGDTFLNLEKIKKKLKKINESGFKINSDFQEYHKEIKNKKFFFEIFFKNFEKFQFFFFLICKKDFLVFYGFFLLWFFFFFFF